MKSQAAGLEPQKAVLPESALMSLQQSRYDWQTHRRQDEVV